MQSSRSAISALTFTTLYSEIEDRLRLVINYADYANRIDFWITRSFLLKLAPSWEEYSYRYGNAQMMKRSESTPSGSTATDGGILAVTEKEGELLEAVDMTYQIETGMFEIRLRGRDTQAIALLNEEMMMSLIKTIFNAAPHMGWGISPALLVS